MARQCFRRMDVTIHATAHRRRLRQGNDQYHLAGHWPKPTHVRFSNLDCFERRFIKLPLLNSLFGNSRPNNFVSVIVNLVQI